MYADLPDRLEGSCACGMVGFALISRPFFVHCCHCTRCRRETGSAFAINALIETSAIEVDASVLRTAELPSKSGRGQSLVVCAMCSTTLWSHYSSAGEAIAFVRVGALREANLVRPDIHIFTKSKLDWVE